MGPLHVGLHSAKSASRIFDKLMSYRSYMLGLTMDTCSSVETTEIPVHIKILNLTMKNYVFDGVEPSASSPSSLVS